MAVAVQVDVDTLCGTMKSAICEVAGLELSVAPTRAVSRRPVLSNMTWVPYGEIESKDASRAAYSTQVLALLKTRLLPELQSREELPRNLQQVRLLRFASQSSYWSPCPSLFC